MIYRSYYKTVRRVCGRTEETDEIVCLKSHRVTSENRKKKKSYWKTRYMLLSEIVVLVSLFDNVEQKNVNENNIARCHSTARA